MKVWPDITMNLKFFPLLITFSLLGACSTLPSSGPTGGQITATAREALTTDMGLEIVPVVSIADVPAADAPAKWQMADSDPPPTDMIGAGDVLSITVFEAGIALFGGTASVMPNGGTFDPSVRSQTLPPQRVDDDGMIDVPYVGRLRVAGQTIAEVQQQIRGRLRSFSQDPQVLVSREQVIRNSIIVGGEIVQPGRLVLETNRESMADVVALAGGYRGDAKDLLLRVERGQNIASLRLSDVLRGTYGNLRAHPGDRLTLIADPLMFSILGASGRVQQMPFAREHMSAIEAIARAGGPSDNAGDPKAVFLFRYVGPDRTQPTVYHFNMMEAPTFFLAQRFALRDGDVLYFGNSAANQPLKVIQTIGQLFAPIVTATALTNTLDSGGGGTATNPAN